MMIPNHYHRWKSHVEITISIHSTLVGNGGFQVNGGWELILSYQNLGPKKREKKFKFQLKLPSGKLT